MKCPKCGYIGFEHTERCRNCGYEFALAPAQSRETDLPLGGQEAGPLADFDLGAASRSAEGESTASRRYHPEFDPRITPPARSGPPDLPLFGEDELPIVPAAGSVPPLAVRRSTPPASKARPRPTPRGIDAPVPEPLPLSAETTAAGPAPRAAAPRVEAEPSGLGGRILASLIDLLLLLGTDAVVIYFTLQICRLAPSQVFLLPLPPLLAFLLLLNGGYLVMLTAAGGQTLGKMAMGLKVIGSDEGPVPVSRSVLRVAMLLASALPAGLGLLSVLVSADRRGLHDRLADTRVVHMNEAQ